MIKYLNTKVTFEEIPDEVSLCFNITNCTHRCKGCHSPELRLDIGVELTDGNLDSAIRLNSGVTCVCFLGEGTDSKRLHELADRVRTVHGLKAALYSGRNVLDDEIIRRFDYVKTGEYLEDKGGLNHSSTNQRLYAVLTTTDGYNLVDITKRFW